MFKGSLPALITPFLPDGSIDFKSFRSLIQWQIEVGSDALLLLGSTGEGLFLSKEEKTEVIKVAVEECRGRIPVIASAGSASTWETLENVRNAKELGADGCQVIVPYYVKPTEEGTFLHFQAISKLGFPTIVYHHPGRTNVRLSALTLSQISLLPNIVGIKEATADVPFAAELLNECKTALLSGEDFLTCDMLDIGFCGSISVMANLIPREWHQIVKHNDREKFLEYMPLMQAIFSTVNPQGIKYAMSVMELCLPEMRLPLILPCIKTRSKIECEMEKLGMIRCLGTACEYQC